MRLTRKRSWKFQREKNRDDPRKEIRLLRKNEHSWCIFKYQSLSCVLHMPYSIDSSQVPYETSHVAAICQLRKLRLGDTN